MQHRFPILRITRLALSNWRNFRSVDFLLGQRSFFVGPNAAGKSNLLDAIRFLRDIVSVGGGFQEALRARGGLREVRCFAAKKNPNVRLEIDLGDDANLNRFNYLLEFGVDATRKSVVVVSERVSREGRSVLTRPDGHDKGDPKRLTETALEQVNANAEFREVAEFLKSVRYLHVLPEVVRDPKRSSGTDDPFGGDLIERIARTPKRSRDARLKRMEEALQIAVPQLRNLELEVDVRGTPHLRAKYDHWRRDGAWQREDRFSDGTLRLLGLIWSLQEVGGPILLEEPEMSLNPGVVSEIAPLVARATFKSRRQSLMTTHSPELLSNGVALEEVHLLKPSPQGTVVESAPKLASVVALVRAGVPVGEALLPEARAIGLAKLSQLDLLAT